MTLQQKTRLGILHANIIYCAEQLMDFHKKHLPIIHQWRGSNITESEEDKAVIEKWRELAFNHDEAKKIALNFELALSSLCKYQKGEKTAHFPIHDSKFQGKQSHK